MRSVDLEVLKNRLSEYVCLDSGGETILVTDREKVVAELRQPRDDREPLVADALLAEILRKGWLSAPLQVPQEPPRRKPVAPWAEIQAELDVARADRA